MSALLHAAARALAAGLLVACVSQEITPAALRALGPEGQAAALRLEAAVELADAFLTSGARETLPAGRLAFQGERLVFTTPTGDGGTTELDYRMRRTFWGDLCVATGFAAQERGDGFVVGGRGEGDGRLVNSLLVYAGGAPKAPPQIAELILHELTHTVLGVGTVSLGGALAYYAEAVFLLRYADHSAERLPYATSREFLQWFAAREGPG